MNVGYNGLDVKANCQAKRRATSKNKQASFRIILDKWISESKIRITLFEKKKQHEVELQCCLILITILEGVPCSGELKGLPILRARFTRTLGFDSHTFRHLLNSPNGR